MVTSRRPPMKMTVVTVVLNDEAHLRGTIESVLGQDWSNVEYIIIDGGSTDSTFSIIKEYRTKIHRIISERDDGIYPAMNKGIELATGEYIHFMNSGDSFYDNGVISRIFGRAHQSADIIYGDTQFWYPDGKTRIVKAHPPDEIWKPFFNHQAAFFRTSLLKSNGFDPKYRPVSDFHFVMKSSSEGAELSYLPIVVNTYLIGGDIFHQEFKAVLLYWETTQMFAGTWEMKWYYLRKILWIGFITKMIKPILPKELFFRLQRLFRKFFPES